MTQSRNVMIYQTDLFHLPALAGEFSRQAQLQILRELEAHSRTSTDWRGRVLIESGSKGEWVSVKGGVSILSRAFIFWLN
ncbi:MAG: hypothetical protein JNM63_01720 [Spirochaetia bacterium]|nr:hypothetical protein [Spirochaetia bacterium]